jgi:hypothetical protein
MYLTRLFVKVFLGPQAFPNVKEGTLIMVVSVMVLGIMSFLLGIFSYLPSQLAAIAWGGI